MPSAMRGSAIRTRNILPEFGHLAQAVFWFVGGQYRRIQRPNGNPGHPVGLETQLMQRLIRANMVSAQCAAALQHQHILDGRVRNGLG